MLKILVILIYYLLYVSTRLIINALSYVITNQISKVGFTYQLRIDSDDFSLEIELISHQKETKVHLQNELWKFYLYRLNIQSIKLKIYLQKKLFVLKIEIWVTPIINIIKIIKYFLIISL